MIVTIVAIVIIALVVFGVINANKLKNIQIVSKVKINGTKQEVIDMVRYLNNFPKWSPFLAEDPTQKYYVKGVDGQVGAQYHWDGNKGKDLGYQQIEKIESNYVGMKCNIQKPFKAEPTFDYYFTETTNGIEVKQDFKVKSNTVSAFFMWLFNAKAAMQKTNEKGLNMLRLAVEQV
jgi:hypothetical protein